MAEEEEKKIKKIPGMYVIVPRRLDAILLSRRPSVLLNRERREKERKRVFQTFYICMYILLCIFRENGAGEAE